MSVELDPPELGFRRPFSHEVTQILKLTNNNSDPVAFKVKTTAPKQYCVRPNSGHIAPGKSVEVQVLLQAMKEDPPLDARCRDKFLVQSVAINGDQELDESTNVWSQLDSVAKDAVKEKKIRVNFLPVKDGSDGHHAAAATNGTSHEAAPPYSPPSPPSAAASPTNATAPTTARDFSTPSKSASGPESPYAAAGIAAVTGAGAGAYASQHSSKTATTDSSSAPITERAAEIYNSAAASVSNAANATGETIQQQLDAAKETIISLKEQIQSQNLRQRQSSNSATASGTDSKERSGVSGATTTATQPQIHTTEGVPVQMVAALCMLSFLIAYFFF